MYVFVMYLSCVCVCVALGGTSPPKRCEESCRFLSVKNAGLSSFCSEEQQGVPSAIAGTLRVLVGLAGALRKVEAVREEGRFGEIGAKALGSGMKLKSIKPFQD